MILLIVQENDVPIPFPQPDRDFIQIIAMRLNDPRSSDSPDRDGTPGPGRVGVDRELIARQLLLPEGFTRAPNDVVRLVPEDRCKETRR
jgi:hypothetical protein